METVKVSWEVDGYHKFLTGELVFEDSNFIKVRGFKDNTIFEIAKKTILELQRGGSEL